MQFENLQKRIPEILILFQIKLAAVRFFPFKSTVKSQIGMQLCSMMFDVMVRYEFSTAGRKNNTFYYFFSINQWFTEQVSQVVIVLTFFKMLFSRLNLSSKLALWTLMICLR